MSEKIIREEKQDYRWLVLCVFGIVVIFVNMFSVRGVGLSTRLYLDLIDPIVLWGESSHDSFEKEISEWGTIPEHIAPLLFKPIRINEANMDLLCTISGIGPRLATNIIESRTKIGPFHNLKDLLRVKGIGKKRLLKIKDHISFDTIP